MSTVDRRNTKEYWNERAEEGGGIKELVYFSHDWDIQDFRSRKVLSLFKDKKVLDVCCGFGRFSDIFQNYTGIDFSEGMIKLARERYPGKYFVVSEAEKYHAKFDVVFEVISLSSLQLTEEEFFEKYKKLATEAVICIEPRKVTIFYL